MFELNFIKETMIKEQGNERIDLIDALNKGDFFLEYQPVISNQTGQVRGLEALIRLASINGPVPPSKIISQAERTGEIEAIGFWVMEEAATAAKRINSIFPNKKLYISVNVSARQLENIFFAERVCDILTRCKVPYQSLAIEVTESVFSNQRTVIEKNLHALRKLGVKIMIDDFGTGFSTLVNLVDFPFDKLKIDKCFIDRIETDHKSKKIVQGILSIADALDKKVIIEGVETEKQFWEVLKIGGQMTQGYFFARPSSLDQCENMIRSGASRNSVEGSKKYYSLYVSKSNVSKAEAERILQISRVKNQKNNVTGFLIHANGRFMQFIEGEQNKVEEILQSIRRDERHRDMRVIMSGFVSSGLFPDWSMGFWDMDERNTFVSSEEAMESLTFAEWKARAVDLMEMALEPKICKALFASIAGENIKHDDVFQAI